MAGAGEAKTKASCSRLGCLKRRHVIAAHAVLADFRHEPELELLAHNGAQEAADRMRLPMRLGHDIVDADTRLPPQQRQHEILFAADRRGMALLLGTRCFPRSWPAH